MGTDDVQTERFVPFSLDYDPRCPSTFFTKENTDYIDSVNKYLTLDEINKLRMFERFVYNSVAGFFSQALPGLRNDDSLRCLYIRRFSKQPCLKMMDQFLDVSYEFLDQRNQGRCLLPTYRVTVGGNQRYYPILYHGDLKQWDDALRLAARKMQVTVAYFKDCMLLSSDGHSYRISEIELGKTQASKMPKDW